MNSWFDEVKLFWADKIKVSVCFFCLGALIMLAVAGVMIYNSNIMGYLIIGGVIMLVGFFVLLFGLMRKTINTIFLSQRL